MHTQQPDSDARNDQPGAAREGKVPAKDPAHPTATAPPSVEESVYEEAEWVGKDGPDAASPDTAEGKPAPSGDPVNAPTDLAPDEAADVMETQEEAERVKDAREDTQDENLISLDVPD
jgi:hypothetical protein